MCLVMALIKPETTNSYIWIIKSVIKECLIIIPRKRPRIHASSDGQPWNAQRTSQDTALGIDPKVRRQNYYYFQYIYQCPRKYYIRRQHKKKYFPVALTIKNRKCVFIITSLKPSTVIDIYPKKKKKERTYSSGTVFTWAKITNQIILFVSKRMLLCTHTHIHIKSILALSDLFKFQFVAPGNPPYGL